MPSIPTPRTLSDIEKTLKQTFVTTSGVNDLNVGSSINSFLEAAALSDFRSQGDIIAALNSNDIDRAESSDLDNIGTAQGVPRPQAKASTGSVTILSTNFTKISTKIYAGNAAPPLGSTVISVSDASLFPASGKIYIGRGSNNVEGPITYSSINPVGNYYQINLSTPTTKNHNVNESVVLAQGGNRIVSSGAIVQTPSNATTPAVTFRTLINVTIPDGEDTFDNVPVVCTEVGTRGNVPAGAINTFASPPFPSASVINNSAFVSGRDIMADSDYRLLIKNSAQTKTKGTELAITQAAVGVTSTDDNKTVASAQITEPSNRNEPAILYIDDGTAYQPIFQGQGFEQVVDNANGGEKFLQLQHEDITKAQTISSFTAPFALTGGMVLSVEVGGVLSEHTFSSSDFATQNSADTFEIVNSINANNNLLFSARAVNNSTQLIIFAKDFQNEDIRVTIPSDPNAVNANDFLAFSENLTYSLRLYKNDVLLSKDGVIPTVFSLPQSSWSPMSSGETLKIKVDQSIFIIYTFVDSDFIPFGLTSLSQNNPLSSWAGVINNKIAGVTATVDGNELKIVSNKGADDNASLSIDSSGSSLAAKMFGFSSGILSESGKQSDYSLNRATAQIELNNVLSAGDVITAGSKNTRAFVNSTTIPTGIVNLPAATGSTADPRIWILLDAPAQLIPNTANASTTVTITNPSTNLWRFTSSVSGAFSDVLPGDWVILSDDSIYALDADFISAFKVNDVDISGNYFEFYMSNSLGSTGSVMLQSSNRITFIRSEGAIQEISLLTGSQTLTAIASDINTKLQGGFASALGGKVLKISSDTYNLNGAIMMCGITTAANILGFVIGDSDASTVTHTAFAESGTSELTIPDFINDIIATGTSNVPPINISTTADISSLVNSLISFLNPFGKQSSNKNIYTQLASATGTSLTLRSNNELRDVLSGDRYFPAEPFNLESLDNLVIILDEDSVDKSLNIKMGRRGTVSSTQVPTQTQFKAYDSDAGPTSDYPIQFGNNFDFKDFYLYFRARQILDPAGVNNKILLKAVNYGPSGESIRFGIAYPVAPASSISSSVIVNKNTKIKVFLASGSQRLGGAWDSTTQFDVSLTGPSTWRYTYNGIGTAPAFVGGAGILVGDIVNIANTSNFSPDNTGIFRVTAVTNAYFEVMAFYGVTENNIQLNSASDLIFYPLNASNNKATDIATYVQNNLSNYLSISQLQSGAGVISTSTYDDQVGTSEFVSLVDGFNAISYSNIGTTISPQNQFNLKVTLQIPESDPDYTLVGEDFYIVPSTADQITRFLNIFSVTGLSSIGNISVSSNAGKVQIYSNLFGSSGSVQISGGSANTAGGSLLATGIIPTQSFILPQVKGIQRSGVSTVTVATVDRHGLSVGDSVVIDNVKNSTFNGTFTVTAATARTFQYSQTQPTLNIASSPTGAVRSSNIVTITTTTNHNLAIGDQVTISGVTDTSFDGMFLVTSTPTPTSFTYNQTGSNTTSGSGSVINVASGNGTVDRPYTQISINKANKAGLQSSQWLKLQNTSVQSKTLGFDATTTLSITGLNALNISSGSGTFQTLRTHSGNATTQIKVEKQGQFVSFTWTGIGINPNFAAGGVQESDWVKISGAFSAPNQGIFKIERMYGSNSFYITNPNFIDEEITLSGGTNLVFYSYDSVMPGDVLTIENNVLGASNIGTYTVSSSPFPSSSSITVTPNFASNESPTALASNYTQVKINEKTPYYAYKKALNVTDDPNNSNGLLIVLDNDILPDKVNVSSGSSVSAISKFNFKTSIQTGEDSYKFYLGLIHEVGKVIRGQADDPVDYPGVAASGSYIEISAPLPKRIQISVVVRNRTGVPFQTIKSRVQTAVSSYVNSLGVGDPVVFSEIVTAVQEINGIQAVSISSPTYNSTHDQIVSAFNEKPLVFNAAQDVVVSLAT